MTNSAAGKELAALIKSLSPTERRYVHLHMVRDGKKPGHDLLQLFDHVVSKGDWSEADIQRAFPQKRFVRQPNVARARLLEAVLGALRQYDLAFAMQLDFSRRLDEVIVLYERKQFALCARQAKLLQAKAAALQLPLVEHQVTAWRMRLARQGIGPASQATLLDLAARQKVLIAQIAIEGEFLDLHERMYGLISSPKGSKATKIARAHALLAECAAMYAPLKMAFDAHYLYAQIQVYAAHIRQDDQAYVVAYGRLIQLWESMPERMRMEEERYFKTLFGYAESAVKAQAQDIFDRTIAKLKRILGRSTRLRPVEEVRILKLELMHAVNAGQWQAAFDLLPAVEGALHTFRHAITPVQRLGLSSNALVAALVAGRWQAVLDWADIVQSESSSYPSPNHLALERVARWVALYMSLRWEEMEQELTRRLKAFFQPWLESVAQAFLHLLQVEAEPDEQARLGELASLAEAQLDSQAGMLLKIWVLARQNGQTMAWAANTLR